MHCSHWKPHITCGLALLLLSGCQWYSPYGYGYPGTYAAPPGTVMPQSTYPAPGTYVQPGSPSLAPQSPSGGSQEQWRAPTPIGPQPNGASDAPLFNPNSQGGASSDGLVPKYGEPGSLPGSGASRSSDDEEETPFSQTGAQSPDTAQAANVRNADLTADASDGFEEPVPFDPSSGTRAASGTPNPYDYDRDAYSWLRGVVDYDPREKTWHIIYNLRPGEDDRLGGGIRLLNDEKLRLLRNQDVVLLEGTVDYDHLDRNGKPQYRVDHLARLKPGQLE